MMKKFKGVYIIFVIVFVLFFSKTTSMAAGGGQTDISGPVISNISISSNGATVKSDDTLVLSFNAEDESDITDVRVCFMNHALSHPNDDILDFSAYTSYQLIFNIETGKYDMNITIPSSAKNGEWKLCSIEVHDEYNNIKRGQIVPDIKFFVTEGVSDITPPVVSDITLDKTGETLKVGDTFTLSFKAMDESTLKEASICFESLSNPGIGFPYFSYISDDTLTYNNSSGMYEIQVEIQPNMLVGEWNLDYLLVFDEFNNYYHYDNRDFIWNNELSIFEQNFIENYYFILSDGVTDITPPVVSDINIDKNGETLKGGDSFIFSFKAEDESLINDVCISFHNYGSDDDYGISFVPGRNAGLLTYNNTSDRYETIITIPENTKIGEWTLTDIIISDEYRNYYNYNDQDQFEFYIFDDRNTEALNTIQNSLPNSDVTIALADKTVIPKEVFALTKANNNNLIFTSSNNIYTWNIKGSDIVTTDELIDLGVTLNSSNISNSVINTVLGGSKATQISLNNNGLFGFDANLTLNMFSANAGMYANLYYNNNGVMEYVDSNEISEGGSVSFMFSHASDYLIVLSDTELDSTSVYLPEYVIEANTTGNGSISPSGNVRVNLNSNQTFNIISDNNYVVNYVVVDGINIGAVSSYTFSNVRGNHSIAAIFKPVPSYTIAVTVGANGSISTHGIVSVIQHGNKTFTFTPSNGYVVSAITVDGVNVGTDTTYTFNNVIQNHTLAVTFKEVNNDPPVVVLPPSGGGGGGGGFGSDPDKEAVTPTPTPSPDDDLSNDTDSMGLLGCNGEATITITDGEQEGDKYVTFELPYDDILKQVEQYGSQEHPIDITIPINSEQLIKQMKDEDVKTVNITVTIPSDLDYNENIGNISSVLNKELLRAAKDNGKNIMVSIADENGKIQYSWSFDGSNMAESDREIGDINLSLEVDSINNTQMKDLLQNTRGASSDGSEGEKGLVINFAYHGELPEQASVRVYVGNQEGINPGDNILLYYYNSDTSKLESLPYNSGYIVDANGYVTIQILHCSDYVLLTDTPDKSVVTTLIDQINVSISSKLLYYGGSIGDTAEYNIKLPSTLEWISKGEKTSSSAIGAVKITFTSTNPKVATIDNKGHIVAKSIGTATVTAEVKLYDGSTKTYKATITVKEPYITISKSIPTMKLGDTYTFTVNAYGYKKTDVIWTTSIKNVVNINKKTGKTTAVSAGTDYIVAKVGGSSVKIKVVVSK